MAIVPVTLPFKIWPHRSDVVFRRARKVVNCVESESSPSKQDDDGSVESAEATAMPIKAARNRCNSIVAIDSIFKPNSNIQSDTEKSYRDEISNVLKDSDL
jgi:hypothetical protein